MFSWFQRNKSKQQNADVAKTPTSAFVESEPVVETESDEPAVGPKQFWNAGISVHDWVGEIYNEQLKKGAFDNLPGKGKPIEVPSGDITNSIFNNANVIPGWLTLQHEIRDELHHLITSLNEKDESLISPKIDDINKKIMKYNNMVPSPILQKRKISRDNLEQQLKLWL
ncbi:DUF1992 domain-containing protein [Paenibacillus sp. sptzw28]|uniref:DnaJ family domain-containing protein n=1 Tax=Paenibacillus sp. sptzw28 TaxID=715179 RepID=UPI001C6F3FDA|nr:DnaJ family domain-containing protein [Paenibacillus sp. sptzw28]QYR19321.1 DUF1992 domain-containing protein [Paenibacillus sp. sptzw28]